MRSWAQVRPVFLKIYINNLNTLVRKSELKLGFSQQKKPNLRLAAYSCVSNSPSTLFVAKNLGPSQSSTPTLGTERGHLWPWRTQILQLIFFSISSYSFQCHFYNVVWFIWMYFCKVLKKHNLQLGMLHRYGLTFRNIFLLISFFLLNTFMWFASF
jgi:hypothetical protein